MKATELHSFDVSRIKNLHVYGRTGHSGNALALFWTASGFSVDCTSGELWAELEGDYNNLEAWVSVWVNGNLVSRFIVQKGRRWYCLFRGLSSKKNRFTLLKETQAMGDDSEHLCLVHALGVPSSNEGNSDEIFLPQEKRDLNIEFIGDSLTSGEGLYGGTQEMDWIPGWQGLSTNFALNTAKALNADFRLLSQCGWGIVSGWDNNRKSAMPLYYGKICGFLKGERNQEMGALDDNDFEKWQPDFVVINLGTNDWGAFNNAAFKDEASGEEWKLHLDEEGNPVEEDKKLLIDTTKNFLRDIRAKNPNAKIIWAYGMCVPTLSDEIKKAMEEYKAESGDTQVDFILLDSMINESEEERGSRMHPGKGTHERAWKTLVEEIRRRK